MEFVYSAYEKGGKAVQGTVDAASPTAAASMLRAQGLLILSVQERRSRPPRVSWSSLSSLFSRFRFLHVSSTERVLLARHLALILRSGIPIDRALDILQEHRRNRALHAALQDIVALIRKGEALSEALARYPAVFPAVAVAVIRWGEAGGSLVESLEHLAAQMEKDHDLQVKVRGAFIYPTIVIGATVVVGIIMSVFILPRIVDLLENFQVDLPFTTRLFLATARFLLRYWLTLVPLALLLPVALVVLWRSRMFRPMAHRLTLRLPIVGPLVQQVNLARFDRTLGSLLRSGIPTVEALKISSDSLGNELYRRSLAAVAVTTGTGVPISRELATQKRLFPSIQVQMISVGEATGRLAEVLLYLAEFTEREVDAKTKNLATAIEPLLLLGIGLLVGGVAVAIITPIYQLVGSFSQ